VAGLADAGQALDIEVNQVTRMLVFVSNHRRRRVERAQAVQSRPAQNAADGGPAELEFVGDPPAVPALPAKNQNPFQ